MISGLIPNRYAKALYKFAVETGKTKQVYEEMKNVISAFSADARLQKIMANPHVDRKDKETLLLSAAGDKPGDDYTRFVSLILDHHREEFAYLMALAYREIYRKDNHISQVKITTAAPLPEAEMDKLKAVVERAFKGMSFEYHHEVDPNLIGGFVIDVDSARMNASISSELEQLRQNLSSN
ncbi:MAG: F0F1 ATP synthase subunit delta [Muribaculaceae bacterium]|nr:F0F1 ATP synthase subunit delta [Muribaculaceae bacterium]